MTSATGGPHLVHVQVTDNNPNVGQNVKTVSVQVAVDIIPPTVKITGAFDSKGNVLQNGSKTVTTGAKFYVTGTDNYPGVVVKCQIDGAAVTTPTLTNGVSTCSYANLLASTKHTFKAWTVDAVGNVSKTLTWTWMINPPVQKK